MGFYKYYYYVCKKGGNMKRILSILVTLLALSAYAEHEYIPFVENGKVWVDYDYQGNYKQVGINDTTVINQKKYHKLYKEEFCAWGGTQTPTSDSQLHGYIREEDKRVYVRGVNDEQECLIYDFGTQAGDTIEWAAITYTWTDDIHKRYIVVDSILTTSYYGKERNVYYVTCIEREFDKNGVENLEHGIMYFDDVWIEGIGTLQHPIMSLLDDNCRWGATGMVYFNYCYNYNTEEIFPTDKTPKPEFSYPEQEYIPILSPSNEWVEHGYKRYMQYTVGEMVELYGKNYYTINETELSLPDQVISHSKHKSYYREEDKKLYMLNVDEDFLVFDFGANAGDTVTLKPFFENEVRKIIIDSIQSTTLNGKVRDIYYVDYGDETDVWIEGIGPIHSFLFNEGIRWGGVGYSYFHYYYDNSTQYVYPEDSDVLDFSAVHSLQAEAHTLTLHREGDALMAVFPVASAGEAITLYDATGRMVATQPIRTGATTATIDITALPAGVYIASLNSGATAKVVL